jgi:DNA-binding IclR family transcriptional regulator
VPIQVKSVRGDGLGRSDERRPAEQTAICAVTSAAMTGRQLTTGDDAGTSSISGIEHRTVSRITTILETVAADSGGVRLSQLAEVLNAPKSSVFSLVKGLVRTGYLNEDRGAYILGPAVHALLDFQRPTLPEIARPYLEQLHKTYDETIMLATPVGDSVVYLIKIESTQSIRYSAPLHTRRPLYPTSTGKSMLAYMPDRIRERYLRAWVSDEAQRERAEAELAKVRETGVATNNDETLPDVSAVAAAILVDNRAVASIAVAGPTGRMVAKLSDAAVSVREMSNQVASRLSPSALDRDRF